MNCRKLHGITVAMVAPFAADGTLDEKALAIETNMLIDNGINCLYPCGTTGEMLHMAIDERKRVAEIVIKEAAGRVPVYIHVGTPDLESTVELAKHAEKVGADGIGVVTPFAADENCLESYFITVATSVGLPVYLYNIPQSTKSDIKPALVQKLAWACSNIIGIKYSFLDFKRTLEYLFVNDNSFEVMHGSDRFLAPLMAMGCSGTISGNAGIFPEPYVALYKAVLNNDFPHIRELMKVCTDVSKTLRGGKKLAYFKSGLKYRGIDVGYMRPPQMKLSEGEEQMHFEELDRLCEKYGFERYLI